MEKTVKNSLALTYEGAAEFAYGEIWLAEYGGLCARICDAFRSEEDKPEKMRCRIQLTVDRLPDDKLEVEVK